MSAFPESGRSDREKLGEIRVRFRPIGDVSAFNFRVGDQLSGIGTYCPPELSISSRMAFT